MPNQFHFDLGGRDVGLGRDELRSDAPLLNLKLLEWYGRGTGQMRPHQCRSLRFQPVAALARSCGLLLALGVQPVDGGEQPFADAGGRVRIQLDVVPVLSDRLLDPLGADVALLAAVPLLVAADAEEVEVGAFGVRQAEPLAAGAVDRALEVVAVLAVLLARVVVAAQDLLDPVEELLADQGLMATGVLDPAVADEPDVVAVLQDRREVAPGDRLFGVAAGRLRPEPLLGEVVEQGVERVPPGGVGAKCPLDQRRARLVDFDRPDLVALDDLTDVAIAERRAADRAAEPCFLGRLGDDFIGEVRRVELGHARHDSVQELTLRRLVDVLGARDQPGPGCLNGGDDLRIVQPLAGEPVELVDDDVVGRIPFEVGEHLLERRPVGRPARLRHIYVRVLVGRLELLGLAVGRVPLRLYREPLVALGAAHLPFG